MEHLQKNKFKSPKKKKTLHQSMGSRGVSSNSIQKSSPQKQKIMSLLEDDTMTKELELNDHIKNVIIKEAFRMFDTDKSGEIDKKEFRKLVQSLGLEMNINKIDDLMKKVDKDGSGNIDIDEFTAMMMTFQFNSEQSILGHLAATFTLYDKDDDGIISEEDLLKVSMELEEMVTPDEVLLLIDLAHSLMTEKAVKGGTIKDRKFGIDKDEFINMLLKIHFLKEKTSEDQKDTLSGTNGTKNHNSSMSLHPSQTQKESKNESKVSDNKSKSIKSGSSNKDDD